MKNCLLRVLVISVIITTGCALCHDIDQSFNDTGINSHTHFPKKYKIDLYYVDEKTVCVVFIDTTIPTHRVILPRYCSEENKITDSTDVGFVLSVLMINSPNPGNTFKANCVLAVSFRLRDTFEEYSSSPFRNITLFVPK